jgi:hypothetical protein
MTFILLSLLAGAFVIELFRKYVLRIKDPSVDELWVELEEQDWFENLESDPDIKEWIENDKEKGLLRDPYYVRKIIDNEGHRQGFIKYVIEKAKR